MSEKLTVSLFDLITCLSQTMDLINPVLSNHHLKTGYIAWQISRKLGYTTEKQNDLLLAGCLHDIGALSMHDKISALEFDFTNNLHSEYGFLILKNFKPLQNAAKIIKFHHVFWDNGKGIKSVGGIIPLDSHILHLADRISISIDSKRFILDQSKEIINKIKLGKGNMFVPEFVDAFIELSSSEYFWFDIVSSILDITLSKQSELPVLNLNMLEIMDITKIFSHILDFRSHFTATHSSGVAAASKKICELFKFSEHELKMMEIAGYLHDLGKLAIPVEIIDKPAKLSEAEYNIMKTHTFYTYRSLERIEALKTINTWASYHHERVDGSGYPFHLDKNDLSLGSRIMAVTDVFVALSEDRPYRKGMLPEDSMKIIEDMALQKMLDYDVVSVFKNNFDDINQIRIDAQKNAEIEYNEIMNSQ